MEIAGKRATKVGDGLVALSRKKLPKQRAEAVERVLAERSRQEGLWTPIHDAHHAPVEWASLLTKYAGRLADNALEGRVETYRKNLVVIAAVCLAALEVGEEGRVLTGKLPT